MKMIYRKQIEIVRDQNRIRELEDELEELHPKARVAKARLFL